MSNPFDLSSQPYYPLFNDHPDNTADNRRFQVDRGYDDALERRPYGATAEFMNRCQDLDVAYQFGWNCGVLQPEVRPYASGDHVVLIKLLLDSHGVENASPRDVMEALSRYPEINFHYLAIIEYTYRYREYADAHRNAISREHRRCPPPPGDQTVMSAERDAIREIRRRRHSWLYFLIRRAYFHGIPQTLKNRIAELSCAAG